MRRLFGKKKEVAPPPSLGETSEKLAGRSTKLEQEQQELTTKINKLVADMKKPENRGRQTVLKRQCLQLMKRRKMIEAQINRVEGQRLNIDTLAMNQESIQMNIDAVNAMKANMQAMKVQMKDISVEGVDDTMFDMEEMLDDCNEISDILAGGMGNDIDEDELNAEFDAMAADMTAEDLGAEASPDPLVTGPSTAPSAMQTQ